jgi:hypothetical protein
MSTTHQVDSHRFLSSKEVCLTHESSSAGENLLPTLSSTGRRSSYEICNAKLSFGFTSRLGGRVYLPQTVASATSGRIFCPFMPLFHSQQRPKRLSSSSTGLIGRIHTDGSLRQAMEVNSYRSEVAHHIDAQPRTRPLLSMLYHLLDFGTAVLASLLHRHGLLLCHIAQLTSGIPYPLHRLLCRVFYLTGCL